MSDQDTARREHMLEVGRASDRHRSPVMEVLGAATRLGLTSFGGPVAHLGYFREEYVSLLRWADEVIQWMAGRSSFGRLTFLAGGSILVV